MKSLSETVSLAAVLFICAYFSASTTYALEPEQEAKVAWLSEQIADYLQMTTGNTFGRSFRDMIAGFLTEEMAEDAPWYQALDKAFGECEAATQDPYNAALQDICERDKLVAIQRGLEVLAGRSGLPDELLSDINRALEEIAGEAAPEFPILDPQTSEQEHYYEQGREVSPAQ
jgi:hypothetical protein